MITCSNHAKSCYDRIAHSIASLALQIAGMPRAPIFSMLQNIQGEENYIRTAFGDSSITINGRYYDNPYQGMLQGNGSGPVTWVLNNAPMVDVHRKKGIGVEFTTSISKIAVQIIGFMFVDDTNLVEGILRSTKENFEEVAERMQNSINCWECSLKATGGAMRPYKSFVYHINFILKNSGECYYDKVDSMDVSLSVKNEFE